MGSLEHLDDPRLADMLHLAMDPLAVDELNGLLRAIHDKRLHIKSRNYIGAANARDRERSIIRDLSDKYDLGILDLPFLVLREEVALILESILQIKRRLARVSEILDQG